MESTVRRKYKVRTLSDGSVEISCAGSRWGAYKAQAGAGLGCLAGFGVALAVVYSLQGLFEDVTGGAFWILGLVAWIVVYVVFWREKRTVVVRPGQGLLFGRHRVPLEEIDDLGVEVQAATYEGRGLRAGGHMETAFVYVEAGGEQLRVTPHLPEARANALLGEVREALDHERESR